MEKREANNTNNSFGIVSVILGVLSIVFSIGINIHGAVLGMIGLIFGIIQFKKYKNNWSLWGIILGSIGTILNIVIFIWLISILTKQLTGSEALNQLNQLQQFQNAYPQ